jgi:hypothetical protein
VKASESGGRKRQPAASMCQYILYSRDKRTFQVPGTQGVWKGRENRKRFLDAHCRNRSVQRCQGSVGGEKIIITLSPWMHGLHKMRGLALWQSQMFTAFYSVVFLRSALASYVLIRGSV